jgi:hypothetical protein
MSSIARDFYLWPRFVQGTAFARRGDESLSRLFEPDAGVDLVAKAMAPREGAAGRKRSPGREVALIKLALQVCARVARRLDRGHEASLDWTLAQIRPTHRDPSRLDDARSSCSRRSPGLLMRSCSVRGRQPPPKCGLPR